MRKRGWGPKCVLVRRYGRWQRGYFRQVLKHLRGEDPQRCCRPAPEQLSFDL